MSKETNINPIIEECVAQEILDRRNHGIQKYGVGLERDDLTVQQWLQHGKEEAMDLAVYLERTKRAIHDELERRNELIELLLRDLKNISNALSNPFITAINHNQIDHLCDERQKRYLKITRKQV